VLYEACKQFQPSELSHGKRHPEEPNINGFGKPAAHQHERSDCEAENNLIRMGCLTNVK